MVDEMYIQLCNYLKIPDNETEMTTQLTITLPYICCVLEILAIPC